MKQAVRTWAKNVLDYAVPRDDPGRRVISWLESAVLAGAGILLPMLCFASSIRRYPAGRSFSGGTGRTT